MKSKKFRLEIPLVNASFWVLYGYKTDVQFKRATKLLKISKDVLKLAHEYEDNEYYACVYTNRHNCVEIVHIISKSKVSHEMVHVIDYVSEYFGFRKEKEFRAYLHDHLVKYIKQKLK